MEVGLPLILIGFMLIVIGILITVISSAGNVEWGGGLVVFIGPFPIVIGGGKLGWVAILTAVILTIAMIVLTLLYLRSAPLELHHQPT